MQPIGRISDAFEMLLPAVRTRAQRTAHRLFGDMAPEQALYTSRDFAGPHRPVCRREHLNDRPLNNSIAKTLRWRLQRRRL